MLRTAELSRERQRWARTETRYAKKIVPDFDTGVRRRYEYCFPLEDRRARTAYVPSGVNNVLVINKAVVPGRTTAILVNELLGF